MTEPEKMGVLDIESTSLDALGFVTGYGLLDEDGTFKHCFLDGKNVDEQEKNLLIQLRGDVCKYDALIGHYIRRFDVPMVISRCLLHELDVQPFLKIRIVDTWEIARNFLLLPKNTLEDLAHFFNIPKNNDLKGSDMPSLYMKASQGDKKTLKLIQEHCYNDCKVTFQVYQKLKTLPRGT